MGRHSALPDLPRPARHRLSAMVGDLRQLASVQRIALRDGPDLGQPLIAFSTGGGLDFHVKEAGTLDIRSLHFRGTPVGWRHPAGVPGNRERALTGFLVTCGLENIGAPQRGMAQHGSLANSPVQMTALGEDWNAAQPHLFVEGDIIQAQPNGGVFRLRRRITAPIGATTLTIKDQIENISATSAEMMILYHINFGFPVAAPGCEVRMGDRRIACIETLATEEAPGHPECHTMNTQEPIILERPSMGDWPGLRLQLSFDADSLPFLQTWRDARHARNILAIEPSNCALGRDGVCAPAQHLAPGEIWQSSLTLTFN